MESFQPLDINRNPIGVLRPGPLFVLEDGASEVLAVSGVYRLYITSDTEASVQIAYPDGTNTTVYFVSPTIEYFYVPTGTEISAPTSGSIFLNLMY